MEKYSDEVTVSQAVSKQLLVFVRPLLDELDKVLDKRLVRTFLGVPEVIWVLRHNRYELLLSELGGYLLGVAHAPAGTKRISNLLMPSGNFSFNISPPEQASGIVLQQCRSTVFVLRLCAFG